jgi:tetratricopeptide (TPR) repeat protein
MSAVHNIHDWDWVAAERDAKEAVRLKPRDPLTIGNLGWIYGTLGRWDQSARLMETALTLDPLFAEWHATLSNVRLETGRLQEAEAHTRKVLQISPTYGEGEYGLAVVLLAQGKLDAALVTIQQEQSEASRQVGLAMIYHAMGRRVESDAALAQVIRENAQDHAAEIADVYAYRREPDQAFTWLETAYRQRDAGLYAIKGDWFFKSLRGDARYKAFLRKMNLPE